MRKFFTALEFIGGLLFFMAAIGFFAFLFGLGKPAVSESQSLLRIVVFAAIGGTLLIYGKVSKT
jgi:hypothetical protein